MRKNILIILILFASAALPSLFQYAGAQTDSSGTLSDSAALQSQADSFRVLPDSIPRLWK